MSKFRRARRGRVITDEKTAIYLATMWYLQLGKPFRVRLYFHRVGNKREILGYRVSRFYPELRDVAVPLNGVWWG